MCDVLWSVTRNTINGINHTAKHLTMHKTHRYRNIMLIIKFGRHRPSLLVSKRDFLFLIIIIIIIIIIIFLSPRLQRQFTSNLLQTSAQWSLGIHLPD